MFVPSAHRPHAVLFDRTSSLGTRNVQSTHIHKISHVSRALSGGAQTWLTTGSPSPFLRRLECFVLFQMAPVTKFLRHAVLYIAFVVLMSVQMLGQVPRKGVLV